jgi:hypothetical protein
VADPAPEGQQRTRRAVLVAAAGGAAALAASVLPGPAAAASAAVMTEVDNATSASTSISMSTVGSDSAFIARNDSQGDAVEAVSTFGVGVLGNSIDTSDPASRTRNAGVVGVAGDPNTISDNIGLTGVYGFSDPSPVDGFVGAGVWGDSLDFGVIGTGSVGVLGDGGWGVRGVSRAAAGIGVIAAAEQASARALLVQGRAEFTRSGRVTMSAGTSTKKVTLPGCTTYTLVLAVLASSRSGRYVRAVVASAGYFTVYLNTTVTSATSVVWIAFTNPANHSG